MPEAKCFVDGLIAIGWKYSVLYPGVINDGSHMYTDGGSFRVYNKVRGKIKKKLILIINLEIQFYSTFFRIQTNWL